VVVVKEINTTSLSAKQKLATMDEVLVLAKLHHPNIVTYHDCFSDAVFINIVMEFCNAGDLAALLKGREGRRMPEAEVMSLFVQVCGRACACARGCRLAVWLCAAVRLRAGVCWVAHARCSRWRC
jgi:serine/threonine protein kinase